MILILFIIAIVIGLLIGIPKGIAESNAATKKQCPYCKQLIHKDATICPFCRSHLN